MMDWDTYFMSLVYFVAMKSKDPSTKVGAVIVRSDNSILSTGYNGLPRGVNDNIPERHIRPEKYFWYEHGERNAIFNSAERPVGCRMYTQGVPCSECARAIIQSGITEIIVHSEWSESDAREKWKESCARSLTMAEESKTNLRIFEGPVLLQIQGFRNEKPLPLKEYTYVPTVVPIQSGNRPSGAVGQV